MKLRFVHALCALLALMSIPMAGHASTVSFSVVNMGGDTWEYTYNVANDTLGVDIEEFTIFFDFALYENLSATSSPPGWDPFVEEPDPDFPDDGYYDALILDNGISPGDSLGGFGIQFDFLGAGAPGSQPFEIFDQNLFEILDSGSTQLSAVPIPAAVWLFGTGLLSLLGVGRYRKRH